MEPIGTLRTATNLREMRNNCICVIMALTWVVTAMGQSSGEEKGTLPPLNDLDSGEVQRCEFVH